MYRLTSGEYRTNKLFQLSFNKRKLLEKQRFLNFKLCLTLSINVGIIPCVVFVLPTSTTARS